MHSSDCWRDTRKFPDGLMCLVAASRPQTQQSFLADILQRVPNSGHEVIENNSSCPYNIYIIPANKTLDLNDGVLQLSPRDTKASILLMIKFFTSIAQQFTKVCLCELVLSGNRQYGSLG